MQYTNSEIAAIIAERIHSERDRRIMSMIWIDGLTQERTAEIIQRVHPRNRKRIKESGRGRYILCRFSCQVSCQVCSQNGVKT